MHRYVFGVCRAHQLVAGIRDERGARIADQRNARAFLKPGEQAGALAFAIVIVVGRKGLGDAMDGQQLGGDAGIFGGNGIDAAQNLQRPERDVPGVADWCRGHIKARRKLALIWRFDP